MKGDGRHIYNMRILDRKRWSTLLEPNSFNVAWKRAEEWQPSPAQEGKTYVINSFRPDEDKPLTSLVDTLRYRKAWVRKTAGFMLRTHLREKP